MRSFHVRETVSAAVYALGESLMRPMIKYRGGKSREIVQYERFIPQDYNVYWEPFFGGGATYFYLEPERAVVSDINAPLMNFYCEVQNRFGTLSAELAEL